MGDLQDVLDAAVADGDAPFLVGMVGSAGAVRWQGAAGEAAPGLPAAPDTVFRIFSMTKAIGSLAAMMLIDRGALAFDTPVEEVLPEFSEVMVLEGWDGDVPRLRKPRRPATLRHLATHCSGLEYEIWNPGMAEWLQRTGNPPVLSGLRQGLFYPMMFDPGDRWGYGIGIDWLGRMVEAVSGQRIDAFLRAEIFDPLGMADTDVEVRDHMAPRLAQLRLRAQDGAFAAFELAPPPSPEVYGMGHCLHSTAPDYMRFLRMLLNRGALDGVRVLSEAAVASMLENHIGDLRVTPMTSINPVASADVELFPGIEKTHSFAFLRVEEDVPGMRRAGAQGWAGLLNTHFWFDPASDLAGVIMTQALPFADPRFMAAYRRFERVACAG
ncbi:MAG: serine hydrolase domain-containing protein [Alkalilacustris sp.]